MEQPPVDAREQHTEVQNYPMGVLTLSLSITMAVGIVATVKLLADEISLGWILFFRYLGCIPLLLVYGLWQQGSGVFRVPQKLTLAIRSIVGILGLASWYLSVTYIPISTATVLTQVQPIIICLLAPLLLGETFGYRRFSAIIVGFFGVLVLIYPSLEYEQSLNIGVIFALSAALFAGLLYIFIRKLSSQTKPITSALYYNTFSLIVVSLYCFTFETVPEKLWEALPLLIMIGVVSSFQQFCMAYSHSVATATSLSPIHYTAVPFSMIVGIAFFNEDITLTFLVGSVMIVGAGVYIFLREQYLDRKKETS